MARPRQFSDEDILEAARCCFLEHGPSVSTTHIAKEVGMSQAALFKRFGTKEELMIASLVPNDPTAWTAMLEGGPDPDRAIVDQLTDVSNALLELFARIMPAFATLKAAGIDPIDIMKRFDVPPPLRAQMALATWLTAGKAQGRIATDDPHNLALLFMASMHSRAMLRHFLGVALGSDDDYIDGVIDTLWNGIAPKEAR